jgi:hypothetical protein
MSFNLVTNVAFYSDKCRSGTKDPVHAVSLGTIYQTGMTDTTMLLLSLNNSMIQIQHHHVVEPSSSVSESSSSTGNGTTSWYVFTTGNGSASSSRNDGASARNDTPSSTTPTRHDASSRYVSLGSVTRFASGPVCDAATTSRYGSSSGHDDDGGPSFVRYIRCYGTSPSSWYDASTSRDATLRHGTRRYQCTVVISDHPGRKGQALGQDADQAIFAQEAIATGRADATASQGIAAAGFHPQDSSRSWRHVLQALSIRKAPLPRCPQVRPPRCLQAIGKHSHALGILQGSPGFISHYGRH